MVPVRLSHGDVRRLRARGGREGGGGSGYPVESRLFDSAHLGPLELPNRLVMAPMTRNRATADVVPLPLMATYYSQRASAGLIIAEASTPNAVGQTHPNITAIHTDAHVAGWRQVTDAVHAARWADVPPAAARRPGRPSLPRRSPCPSRSTRRPAAERPSSRGR